MIIRWSIATTIAVFISVAGVAESRAQQLAIAPPGKTRPVSAVAVDVEQRLVSMGYSSIALKVVGNNIEGTAVRAGRREKVLFDEKGQLHVGSFMAQREYK